jgi:hypothetical protein
MIEVLGYVLAGLSLMVLVGVLIVCYVVWRSNRRMDDAAAEMAKQSSGGGGEPKEPA